MVYTEMERLRLVIRLKKGGKEEKINPPFLYLEPITPYSQSIIISNSKLSLPTTSKCLGVCLST